MEVSALISNETTSLIDAALTQPQVTPYVMIFNYDPLLNKENLIPVKKKGRTSYFPDQMVQLFVKIKSEKLDKLHLNNCFIQI